MNPPAAHRFNCLVIREWHDLTGIRRHGLVGGELCPGVGFKVSEAQARPSVSLFLLSEVLNVELSAPPAPCLPACHHAFPHGVNELIL